jgi:hypothetical protein
MSPLLPPGGRHRHDPEASIPAHPYRDTAILHLVLGALILVFALVTGGDLRTAALVAAGYVVVATAWSWWHFARRIRLARLASETETDGASGRGAEGSP